MTLNGGVDVSVELGDDDFNKCILPKTLEVYNRYRPILTENALTLIIDKQDYNLSRDIVGRGVFDVVPEERAVDTYRAFPSEYWPLNTPDQSMVRASTDLLVWKMNNTATRKILGAWDDFQYFPDQNILRIYPAPQQTQRVKVLSLHNRRFDTGQLTEKGDGAKVAFTFTVTDDEGFPIKNMARVLVVTSKLEMFRDNADGTITGNKGGSGVINYLTGEVTVTFNTAPVQDEVIQWELCEVHQSDYDWYKDYAVCIGDIILGRKRKKFSSIPGSQTSIDLYTDILSEGTEAKTLLEEKATGWMTEWLIPRLL